MKKINIFCFGFGQVAQSFIKKILSKNFEIDLNVTSRDETQIKKIDKINYNSFQLDEKKYDKSLIKELEKSEYILDSIPPIGGEDIVIKNFKEHIKKDKSKWITYLSATSIYGDHKGEWVNEESNTNPTSSNGIARLNAEKLWMSLAVNNNLPLQIFRLSGIYSNKRNVFARIKSGEAKIINKKNHFFSRIHIEDIANILFKSINYFKSKEIYNISDDKPASSEEITLYASKLLGVEIPETIEVENIKSEMLKNFYKDSKKINNKKMKKLFKYELKFPTYIEGLNHIKNNFI